MGIKANDELKRIKDNVSNAYLYFKDNYVRFREFRQYVFKDSITEQQQATLRQLSRPVVQFNILEAYISRLLGEFSKHEPSIEVNPSDGAPINQDIMDTVEGHLRHIMYEANKNSFSYEMYKDLLSGGFSVAKVVTDYASPMSFTQEIYLKKAFDPTLCGFDPMARDSHKGDGQYCFELYPMTYTDFNREYPGVQIKKTDYMDSLADFRWSYKGLNNEPVIIVADYYEKKRKKVKIVKLADGRTLSMKNYEKMKVYWSQQGFIEQMPIIVGEPRMTTLDTICRYRLIESEIIEYTETDYSCLPLVFFDGSSILLTQGTDNTTYQMTRPYVYHAKGVQDMTNFGGQTLCNSMENLVQHKFIVMKEAIPQEQDYLEALNDIQRANTIVVNAFMEGDPNTPINQPIREVQNIPLPPEVMASFQFTGGMTQTILGSYASNLGKNDNDLSGKAVIESSSVGNSAAMPYVVGYLQGLTQCGNIMVDLIPKYLLGKRSIGVVDSSGHKTYKKINQDGLNLDYEERALKVNIEAGVNFQVQKNQAVEQIIALTQANEQLGKFFTSEKGMKILAKNLTIYGADNLEEAIDVFMQQEQQQQQQAMQMQQQAMQQDPRMIKAKADMQKVQIDAQKQQMDMQQQQFDNQIQIAKMAIEKELADAKVIESEAKVSQAQIDSAVRLEGSQSSIERHALDSATKLAEIQSRHHNDHLASKKLEHEISIANSEVS